MAEQRTRVRVCALCGEAIDADDSAEPFDDGWIHSRCVFLLLMGFHSIRPGPGR